MITKRLSTFALATVSAWLFTGCANTEQKLGRGFQNVAEFTRLGEITRSMEQTALFDGSNEAYTTGFIRGLNKSLVRTGVGIYEIVTAPLPPYGPVFTDYMSPQPVYPESYKPNFISDTVFSPDAAIGFAGGDIMPFMPGSRFRIFDY
jgi:putative exosortase-associated protein (TIGR04073 family)